MQQASKIGIKLTDSSIISQTSLSLPIANSFFVHSATTEVDNITGTTAMEFQNLTALTTVFKLVNYIISVIIVFILIIDGS